LTVCEAFGVKKPQLAILPYRYHSKYKFVLDLRAFGKGRKFFRSRAEAEAEQRRQKSLLEIHSREAIGLSPREMSDFITARQKLTEYGKKIGDAVDFFVDYLERIRRCNTTVAQLADEMIEAKRRDGRSKVYLADLRQRLGRFCQDFGQRPIAGITVDELDNWLRGLPGSPQSRANYRTILGSLFSYATRRRMLDTNPVLHTAKPKLIDNPPEIFAVHELRGLLEAATRVEPSVVPMLAIGAFAGLRDAEIKRLDWSEVDLARGHIEVKAAKSKSARRRIVPIQPNLASWLRSYNGRQRQVVPANWRRKIAKVRKAAVLTRWPNNGLRHSFASYRLAAIHDAPRVASELGHTSPQMLYSTYRELVLPEEAERYWKIAPEAESANVVAFSTSV
jgi:integrase